MAHVLLVDDDAAIRESLSELLAMEGYEVTTADGGAAALTEIARHRPDVIVSDVAMPPPDGIRLLELLDTQGVHIPAVLITAQTITRRHSAAALLHKPFGVDLLIDTIERVADGPGA